ncbi:hypothetical protein Pelo_3139 [Pelomyxa schiedti]|nr:hypothetical protein Pelo_3139 [Pelomyxa schiedti]
MRWACSPALQRARRRYPIPPEPAPGAQPISASAAAASSSAGTTSTTATSEVGDEATAARIARVRRNKICFAILSGLCAGGHVGLAGKLVAGEIMGVWWPAPGDPESANLDEDIRDSTILADVAELDDLETAKWLIERFRFHEPWEFADMLSRACEVGNWKLLKWLNDTFHLHSNLKVDPARHLLKSACTGGNLDCAKWVVETFSTPQSELQQFNLLLWTLSSYQDGAIKSSHIEVASWLKESFGITDLGVDTQKQVIAHCELAMVKKIYELLGISTPPVELLKSALKHGDIHRIRWFVEDFNRQLTPEHFIQACGNRRNTSFTLAEWVCSKLTQPLNSAQLASALAKALGIGNTCLSDWLNETFHVIDQIQMSPTSLSKELEEICNNLSRAVSDGLQGVKWFLARIKKENVGLDSVTQACFTALKKGDADIGLLLLEEFHIPPERNPKLFPKFLKVITRTMDMDRLVKVLSLHTFSQEDAAQCLAGICSNISSKMVKYLIRRFHLQREHIIMRKNNLLHRLISFRKINCAQWLVANFHLDARDILEMEAGGNTYYWNNEGPFIVLWRWIIEALPTIGTVEVQALIPFAVISPLCAQKVMQHYGVTLDTISRHCADSFALFFSRVMSSWLHHHCGNLWEEPPSYNSSLEETTPTPGSGDETESTPAVEETPEPELGFWD